MEKVTIVFLKKWNNYFYYIIYNKLPCPYALNFHPYMSKVYLDPVKSMMELLVKTVNNEKTVTTIRKSSIMDIWWGIKYASVFHEKRLCNSFVCL